MAVSSVRSLVRVAVALAIVAAVAGQMQSLADSGALIVENFFSFFTIQSNILACLVLLGLEMPPDSLLGRFGRWARGGMTLYMTMTGVIYAMLLAPISADVSTQLEWVNLVLHVVAPIVVLVDWVTSPPRRRPKPHHAGWWLAFPAVWLVYSFVRGGIIGWYPYPFLDPRPETPHAAGSWAAVAVTLLIVTAGVGVLALLIRWLTAMRGAGAHQRDY
jgi:hypothetical protein